MNTTRTTTTTDIAYFARLVRAAYRANTIWVRNFDERVRLLRANDGSGVAAQSRRYQTSLRRASILEIKLAQVTGVDSRDLRKGGVLLPPDQIIDVVAGYARATLRGHTHAEAAR